MTDPGRRRLVLCGLVAFLMLGVSAAVLGPELPEFRARFHLDVAEGSLLLTANSAGAVVGVLIGGWAQYLRRPRPALIGGSLSVLVGGIALASAASWWVVLTGAALVGIGFGLLDFGVLVVLAASFAESGASVLTSLSAVFSIGAILGPIVVGATPHDVAPVFVFLAVLAAALALLWLTTPVAAAEPRPAATGTRRGPVIRLAIGFAFLLALYVSLENGVGAWETTYLRDAAGYAQSSAARATSLFWLAITVGRLIAGWLARRMSVAILVNGSIVLAAASLVVAGLPGMGLVGFTATGLFLSPIFPAAFAWFSGTRPSALAMTLVFASSVLGPTLSAPVIGAATQSFGASAIPLVLVIVALFDIVAVVSVRRGLERGPDPA